MHELLHLAILSSTLLGAAGSVLLVAWPLFAESPLPATTRWGLAALVGVAAVLLLVEWRFVH